MREEFGGHEPTVHPAINDVRDHLYRDTWYLDAWCRWREALREAVKQRIQEALAVYEKFPEAKG